MPDYFTNEHFALLNKWKGKKRDESNAEQSNAYEKLKEAYEATNTWAHSLKSAFFPAGDVKIHRRPTSQANFFLPYNWARIYPTKNSPRELAYTVGLDAVDGFVVKIDTVGLGDRTPLRLEYLQLRGSDFHKSSIVAILPAAEGLSKSFDELVAWSIEAIKKFSPTYDEIVDKLNLGQKQSDEELLAHFDGKPEFKKFRESWSEQDREIFCKVARAVHAAGLDWWHAGTGIQVRFGRKNPGSERAMSVLGIVRGIRTRTVSSARPLGTIPKIDRQPLTSAMANQLENALLAERENLRDWLIEEADRPGMWPDELSTDPIERDDDLDDEKYQMKATAIQPSNRIYYGPPGTGKTYLLTKLLKEQYEESMALVSEQEWQSQFIEERLANLTWWEGAAATLHELGGLASVDDILMHPFMKAIAAKKSANKSVRNTVWGALQYHSIEDSKTVKMSKRMAPAVFEKNEDSTWIFAGEWNVVGSELISLVAEYKKGAPKSENLKRYTTVTFHQSYGYEEFVEGLRPILGGDSEAGDIKYEIRSGVFKDLCRRASAAPDRRFAIVIDEINRGNISKIFGELITLIEPDKRAGGDYPFHVTLPFSGESFCVPSNVDILGTMNTADRSLALLDTALRRRFEFVPILPDARDVPDAPLFNLRVTSGHQVVDIPRMLSVINQRVEALYDRDHCIGHAYFTSLAHVPDGDQRVAALSKIFRNGIVPLLEEYFFEDWQKIRLVLADNQKPKNAQFVVESLNHEADLAQLFGNDHGLDAYTTKRRYVVADATFCNLDAYIGIYQKLPV